MFARREEIIITEEADAIIGETEGLSSRINTIILRYGEMIRDACPAFIKIEWFAILEATRGTCIGIDCWGPDQAAIIWAEVADCEDLAEGQGVDQHSLAERLRGLKPSEKIAIAEVCHKFWSSSKRGKISNDKLLMDSGANIP